MGVPPHKKRATSVAKQAILINKIHGILISNNTYKKNNSNYPELEKKRNIFDRKYLVTTFF